MTESDIWKIMALASLWGTARIDKRRPEFSKMSAQEAAKRAEDAENELLTYLRSRKNDDEQQPPVSFLNLAARSDWKAPPAPPPKMTTVWKSMYDAPKDGTIILAVLDSTYHKAPYPVFWDGFVWTLAWDGSSATPEAWTDCPRMPTKAEMAIL